MSMSVLILDISQVNTSHMNVLTPWPMGVNYVKFHIANCSTVEVRPIPNNEKKEWLATAFSCKPNSGLVRQQFKETCPESQNKVFWETTFTTQNNVTYHSLSRFSCHTVKYHISQTSHSAATTSHTPEMPHDKSITTEDTRWSSTLHWLCYGD